MEDRILDRVYIQLVEGSGPEDAKEIVRAWQGKVVSSLDIHHLEPGFVVEFPCPDGSNAEMVERTETLLRKLIADPRVTMAQTDQVSHVVPKEGQGGP